jgi:hypothetical protein
MSRRFAAATATLLAALAVAGAGSAAADAQGPDAIGGPLDPATAAALATASAPGESGSSSWIVSPSEALSAAAVPGAATWIDPALSAQQAVGEAEVPSVVSDPPTPTWCWANADWHEWGTWPYEQRLTDTTYWCAVLGKQITYRSTSVTGSGTLCATNWTSSALISGGIGYPWFTTRSSAGFACPTVIPWITLHENRWIDVNRTDTGGTTQVASG